MDEQDKVTMIGNRLYAKRGIVKEFSDDSRRTLRRKIDELFQKEGRFLRVDLTTKTTNPKAATYALKIWKDAMAYDYAFEGVHCLEIQPGTMNWHFHMVIRLDSDYDIADFRKDAFRRWLSQNPSVRRDGQEIKPLTRQDCEHQKDYLAKSYTKELPPALRETGLGCNWCGYFSRLAAKSKGQTHDMGSEPLGIAA